MLNEKSLTLAELEDFVDRHPNNNVKIIGAQTDVETEMSLGPIWTYHIEIALRSRFFMPWNDKERPKV